MRVKPEPRSKSLIQPLMNSNLARSKPKKFMTNIENLKTSQQFYHMTMYTKPEHELTTQTFKNNEFTHDDISLNNNEMKNKDKLELDKEVLNVFYGKSKAKPKRKKISFIKFLVVFIFGTSIAALVGIWREETIRVGYCNVEIKETSNTYSLIRKKFPRIFLDNLFIYCKPCPEHAICYPNFKLVCQKDYILASNILSFDGLIPIAPSCIPDTEKLRKVHIIINEIIQMLRDKNTKLECGTSKLLKGEKEGISENDLEKYLWEMKSPDIDDEQFQELLSDAFKDISTYDEIRVENDGSKRYFKSTSFANIPFGCSLKKYIRRSLVRYRVEFIGIICSIFLLFKIKSAFVLHRTYKSRILELVHISLQRLYEQQRLYILDPKSTYPYIAISHLRDDILVNEFNTNQRNKLWNKVRKVVENNSNIRTRLAEINGEWIRAWEWIGTIHT
ncbi:hypothetical protein T552_03398 [Pneumocystis carinii B80]|uniref:Man1/Src1-like C-terminal domain-containing protein n=1 Tax=Pneumocystis carinii (strain B80) TaxID=1408658 RepID=A0A0W4ZBL4_PNEC8|nr:hypothetical protein T552_03398 [Pneumocystis carinii B80]KTW25785.1 hypothetical protein T552_03398 [Pneumocystis carinii B80]